MNSRFPALPPSACTASDVVALYLHRGAFENALADEDQEQDPDRWVSHTAVGQEAWQLISQWIWNLRLELGHQLHPDPVRTTEAGSRAPISTPGDPHADSCSGVRAGRSRSTLESRPLLGARFCLPTRWHASLSSRSGTSCP